jgi:hypothetical protein
MAQFGRLTSELEATPDTTSGALVSSTVNRISRRAQASSSLTGPHGFSVLEKHQPLDRITAGELRVLTIGVAHRLECCPSLNYTLRMSPPFSYLEQIPGTVDIPSSRA